MPAYSVELGQRICDLIAQDKSLRTICAMEGMPNMSSVFDWLAKHEEFAQSYARARTHQAYAVDSGMRDIEDQTIAGDIDPKAANAVLGNMRWRAERLNPKLYGSRVSHEHSGTLTLESIITGDGPK